jgi:hypothetical protein
LIILVVLLAAVGTGSFWAGGIYRREGIGGTVSILVKNEIDNVVLISENVDFSDGETVFDVLERVAEVEYDAYPGLGKFVTSIEGVEKTENAWWLYYVNETLGPIAADRYGVLDGDNILWKYTSEMPF